MAKKFDAKAEAMKFLDEWNKEQDEMPQIQSETPKREGTRVCVNLENGERLVFHYIENGLFKGWNQL